MSDPREAARLAQALLPPHVGAYGDAALHEAERACIIARSPRYVGHVRMVPEPGDWRILVQEEGGRVLLRDARGEVRLLSNVCRHRQARMLGHDPAAPAGKLGATGQRIVCPVHAWTYDPSGELIGAPHFEPTPCRALPSFPLQEAGGCLFEGAPLPGELRALLARPEFDPRGYQLTHVELHVCRCNWKTFMEIYNDDYHIGPFHPGLGRFVRCEDLGWEFGEHFNLQRVGAMPRGRDAGTPAYRAWREQLAAYLGGDPPFGAVWASLYPALMIEVFPAALVISSLTPRGPSETWNMIEFHYPEEVLAFEPALAAAHRAAYLETAAEDDEIAERIDAGRRLLHARGETDHGPFQSPLEEGMRHFHAWYRRAMQGAAR